MKTRRPYRYRFYLTAEQRKQLAQTFICMRFVYNYIGPMMTYKDTTWRLKTELLFAGEEDR